MVRSRFGTASAIEFGNCRLRTLFGAMFIALNKLSKSTLGRCIENQEIVEICAHTYRRRLHWFEVQCAGFTG